jgi:AbiJ N-terminal domain 4
MTTSDVEEVIAQVQSLRTILIDVGTGKRSIQDAEGDYNQLRSWVSQKLHGLNIADGNSFFSLWDWYNYWKENGLSSYQSRRNYINGIYNPVLAALEKWGFQQPESSAEEPFSVRHGYKENTRDAEITIREEAPEALRQTLLDIATQTGWDYDGLLSVATKIGKQPWEPPEPITSGKKSVIQLRYLVYQWEWYLVYDFIERLCGEMAYWSVPVNEPAHPSDDFQNLLNSYLRHAGIGWELRGDKIVSRGSEAFETIIRKAAPVLTESGQETARREIHEAVADLSRRPHPDVTGAIQHAIAALECVARTVSGDSNPTLGALLKQHPGLIPKPLDIAVEKAWGYASERARHIREGGEPSRGEAELVVGIAASVATYLARTIP